MLEPEPVVVEPDTADPVVVFVVAVDVDVTTDPDAASWLAPRASMIDTSSTVAPLMKISSTNIFYSKVTLIICHIGIAIMT